MLIGEFPNSDDLGGASSTADTEIQDLDDNEEFTTEMILKKRWKNLSE